MKLSGRMRLSTLLLLIAILALVFGLFVQHRRETRLQAELSRYRNPKSESIAEVLDRPLALTYRDGATLEAALKDIKSCSTGRPNLPSGIPIYVDPVETNKVGDWTTMVVKRPPSAEKLTLRAHLASILKPLGLGASVQDGFLMISSYQDANARSDQDPYFGFGDVLR